MFNSFFNLRENPFSDTPDTRFTFHAKNQSEALFKIQTTLDQGLGFTMLTGEVGSGKTHLSRLLVKQIQSQADAALLLFPGLESHDLFGAIAEEFGLEVPPNATLKTLLDQLTDFFIANAAKGRRSVLIVDEAHNVSINALESIRQLSNIEQDAVKLLHIVLVGQPELLERLKAPQARQINQRIGARLELQNFLHNEVPRYVKHRIELAGGTNYVQFSEGACASIFQLSDGLPRLIHLQCRLALEYATQKQIRHIEQKDLLDALWSHGVLEPHRSLPWRREVRLVQT